MEIVFLLSQDLHDRHNKMMASKNDMLKEMQKQLDEKEFDIQVNNFFFHFVLFFCDKDGKDE